MRYRRRTDVCWRCSAGVLVATRTDSTDPPFALAGSAAVTWLLLDRATDVDELVVALAEALGGAADTVRADVHDVLDEFVAHGLVETLDPGDGPAEHHQPPH